MAIPRIAAEIQPSPLSFNKTLSPSTLRIDSQISKQKQVITQHGENVTEAFYRGANIALNLCLQHNIQFALLKESSPSCGSTTIYDGSFTKIKIKGEGITVELLRKNDIEVFSEENIEELINKLANN